MKWFSKAVSTFAILASLAIPIESFGLTTVTDLYQFKMVIMFPRVYDNTKSLGYRKYQTQRIMGYMKVKYYKDNPTEVELCNLVNLTHKVNGKNITYKCYKEED